MIATGGDHTCILLDNNQVTCLEQDDGQLGLEIKRINALVIYKSRVELQKWCYRIFHTCIC